MITETLKRLEHEFKAPTRDRVKVKAWDLSKTMGVVLQTDQPAKQNAAYLWVPYPQDGQTVPEIAIEYPGESGRHSGAYATPGLRKGEPALRLTIHSPKELEESLAYIRAMQAAMPLPEVKASSELNSSSGNSIVQRVDMSSMPGAAEVKPRREAIPRLVQREVWQRDGGRCVECSTRENLCFDHIVPFSRGGSNSVRNIQLLCETCNLQKGNRF